MLDVETSKCPDIAAFDALEKAPNLSISEVPVNLNAVSFENRMGADLQFLGIVRADEHGRKLKGIHYSAYQTMAERRLAEIAAEGIRLYGPHPLTIHHVVGFVATGDASVVIRLSLPHSAEAFEATRWYLAQLKTEVPIWKEPIYEFT